MKEAERGWSFHSRVEKHGSINRNGELGEQQSLIHTVQPVEECMATAREGYGLSSTLRILQQGGRENILPHSKTCRAIYIGMKV